MRKIGFLTDSSADIPQELAEKYGIEIIGFPINVDGKEYIERRDFTNDQFDAALAAYGSRDRRMGGDTKAK